jgi:glycine oxidase
MHRLEDAVTDALVVGGGIMGLLAARELRRLGMQVSLLDRDQPGRQASWASAGILAETQRRSAHPVNVLRDYGTALFPALAAELRDETGLDIDLVMNGVLVPALDDAEAADLEAETRSLIRQGNDCEFVSGAALREAEPSLAHNVVAARLAPGGNVENRRLVRALELANLRAGVEIESGVQVTALLRQGDAVVGVRTQVGERHAPLVVLAAGSWSGQIAGAEPAIPVVPQRGQILSLWPAGKGPRRVILTPGDPYLVPRLEGKLVVGATREFVGYDTSLTAGGQAWLLASAIALIPALKDAPLLEQWVGFRPLSADGVPSIGPAALRGLYYITGHGPTGIAPAPASARLLVALIEGTEPPIPAAPYDPLRFK